MKLFFKDSLGIIALYSISFIALVISYNALGGFEENLGYFIFLNSFLLICFLVYRYISNHEIYKKLSEKPKQFQDIITFEPHSYLEDAFYKTMKEYMKLYDKEMNLRENSQKEYKIMLNQWIHQMKTPVSVINLIAQNNVYNEEFDNVLLQTKRIDYNLSQMLTFLRMEDFKNDMKIEKVALKEVVLEVVNELKEYFIVNSVYPKVSMSDELRVNTDEKWIKAAIYQILSNAIKYSEKNKTISIRAWLEENKVVLEIENEGIGIKKSDIKRIFNLFFTGENGRNYGESTGVGLYIVKKVIDLLQHEIHVESEPEKLTKFYILFKL